MSAFSTERQNFIPSCNLLYKHILSRIVAVYSFSLGIPYKKELVNFFRKMFIILKIHFYISFYFGTLFLIKKII